MKSKDIFTLIGIGIAAWFFLRPKPARAEEIPEIAEVPEPEVYTVPKPIAKAPYPTPGFYFAELIPVSRELPVKEELAMTEEPLSLYDQMESILKEAGL